MRYNTPMRENELTERDQRKPHALGIALVILFIVCLLILLWVLIIVIRFFIGLGTV